MKGRVVDQDRKNKGQEDELGNDIKLQYYKRPSLTMVNLSIREI